MQKLKEVIIRAITSDPFDLVLIGEPNREQYLSAVQTYKQLPVEKKQKINLNFQKKFDKKSSSKQILLLFILCDFISMQIPSLLGKFPQNIKKYFKEKSKMVVRTKEQKNKLALNNFIYFYVQYLEINVWGSGKYENNFQFDTTLKYCQNALKAIKLVFAYDFVIQFLICHHMNEKSHAYTVAIENILKRSSEDLGITIKFIEKWQDKILEKDLLSIELNDIYEQLIYLSKNIQKLKNINHKLNTNIVFPVYQINKQLNKSIEQCMLGKQYEKCKFISEKSLNTHHTLRKINIEEESLKVEEDMDYTESQIIVNVKF